MIELPVLNHHVSDDPVDIFYRIAEMKALKGEETIHHRSTRGHCVDVDKVKTVCRHVSTNLISRTSCGKGDFDEIWDCGGRGLLSISAAEGKDDSRFVHVDIAHYDGNLADELLKSLGKLLTKRPGSSNIMILSQGSHGLSLDSIGKINNPLVPENYNAKTMESYKHVLECLKTNAPCGRFIMLSGPPGTGKSFLIRAITTSVDALFVLVPASLGNQLTGPTILPLLSNYKSDDMPIVLIIEDADTCITQESRTSNPGGLSDILNLGDGLFGQLADIRVLVTSNANKMELDPAIVRPGRMCQHLNIGYLTVEEAWQAYHRLTGKDAPDGMWTTRSSKITLAEVYRRARSDGWTPDAPIQKPIGFNMDAETSAIDRILSKRSAPGKGRM